jgi:hypothetical protein
LLLVLASGVIFGPDSHGNHDHILLSCDSWLWESQILSQTEGMRLRPWEKSVLAVNNYC